MKQILLFLFFLLAAIPQSSFAQKEIENQPNILDGFTSEKGEIITIEDYTVPRLILQLSYGDARIRKITSGSVSKIYYQIMSGDFTGSMPAEEFPNLLNAFETLKGQSVIDVKLNSDALTRQYRDQNGFELGYTMEGKKVTWFVKQFRNCPRTLFIKDPLSLEEPIRKAGAKLNDLK